MVFLRRGRFAALLLILSGVALPATAVEVREIEARPGERVRVDLPTGGRIRVLGWGRDLVRIEADSHEAGRTAAELIVERTAAGIEVGSRAPRGGERWHGAIDLLLQVPERTDLDLGSAGGSLAVEEVSGEIRALTRGGDVELRQVRGAVDILTMGGNIQLAACDLQGDVTTQGGHIEAVDLAGAVELTTQGGNVSVRGGRQGENCRPVRISTLGGNIVAAELPCGAILESMGGNVEVRGAGGPVEATTLGGNVAISACAGGVRASTAGGDVDVVLSGDPAVGDRSVRLASQDGKITLTLPEGSSVEFDVTLSYTRNSDQDYRIDSDFPLEIRESPDWDYGEGAARRYLYGTGSQHDGRNKIKLETMNGGIRIRRGPR